LFWEKYFDVIKKRGIRPFCTEIFVEGVTLLSQEGVIVMLFDTITVISAVWIAKLDTQ
jgi:hypothetical protein